MTPLERLPPPSLPVWIERQLPEIPASPNGGFERFRVKVEGRHLHVMTAGPADAPPVLLLHGNPTWSFLWRKVAAELLLPIAPFALGPSSPDLETASRGARGRGTPPPEPRPPVRVVGRDRIAPISLRLVMPDLVGLGFSDKPRDPTIHTLESHARWIGGVIDGVALAEGAAHGHERLLFVGQDWGGPIGLRAFADRPERLAGLVLLNTAAGPPKPGFQPTRFHRFARRPIVSTVAFRLLGFPQRALHRAQGDPDSIRGEVARAYRYPLHGWSRNAAPLALARMVPDSLDHESVPALARCQELVERFDGPAAIVWGDRDPVLGRLRGRMEKLLPQAEVTATEAGHFLQEEVPREIATAIRRVASQAF